MTTELRVADPADRIAQSLAGVMSGKDDVIHAAMTTLFAGGHLLIEDVPGVGKTTLATALARSIGAESRRIQFTSDMLPSDVTGLSVYDQEARAFQFHPGPIFTNIVIGDEINRATPKTQSALLEAMGESAVTVDGKTLPLPELFIVVATQNPQDMEGTFPLPEAQRDRFMTRIAIGYPEAAAELHMLQARSTVDPAKTLQPVATVSELVEATQLVNEVHVSDEVGRYLIELVGATREHPGLALGASPRATLHLTRMAKARAAINGRAFVTPDDVATLATTVLAHRLGPQGRFANTQEGQAAASHIITEIVARTPAP